MVAPDTVELRFRVAPGYYMYRERFGISISPLGAATLGEPVYPKGDVKYDPTFEKDMEVYHQDVAIRVPVTPGGPPFTLTLTGQSGGTTFTAEDILSARLARGERLTVREFEGLLREKLRVSRSEAEEIAALGYKAWLQRDVGRPGAIDADGVKALSASLAGFDLPSL